MTASLAINLFLWSSAAKQFCTSYNVHDAAHRLRRVLWRKQQERGISLDLALGDGHVENLFHIPAEMIDY